MGRGIAVLLTLAATAACAEAQTGAGTIAFTDVTVLPMDRPGTVSGQTVLVQGTGGVSLFA